jgi:isocitrate dehydrogenase (NAD+)
MSEPAAPSSAVPTVTLLAGDGIGPEVADATLRALDAAGARVEWERHLAGADAVEKHGSPLPQEVLDSIVRNRVALKGPVTTPVGKGFTSVNVGLRQALQLFANVRPAKSFPGIETRFPGVDLLIVRENTEGLYRGIEHEVVPGVVESIKVITADASNRIARFAFDLARRDRRKRITAVHKANIMKKTDGLFLDCFRRVSAEYPEIVADDRIIDNLCMQLVVRPETYDVLLLENLYGDIVSDLAAGLVGGLGVVPGANLGADSAVFEAVHGSAPDIAGQNLANPLALMQTAVLMLDYLGQAEAAERLRGGLYGAVALAKVLTKDLGGQATTSGFTDAVIAAIDAGTRWPSAG